MVSLALLGPFKIRILDNGWSASLPQRTYDLCTCWHTGIVVAGCTRVSLKLWGRQIPYTMMKFGKLSGTSMMHAGDE